MAIQDNNAFLMAKGADSRIEIHAADASKTTWTQLSETAAKDSTTLTLADVSGWEEGDKIVIASTGFEMNEAEYRTIVSVDGNTITLDAALENDHFGEIETYDNGLEGEDFRSWDVDMRAEVALLSRNVTIQGDEDASVDGYGGHIMVMMGASMRIDGAELTKMGQIGDVGRYPLHWHMLGDASGQFVTNSSVHETYNKGVTIHGTQNTWLENNAIVNTIGHTYYFEDGSEYGNVLLNNLGMNTVEAASVKDAPIGSDHTEVSTYWVTNPNNHLIGNHAAGSDDTGFWVLSQNHTEGLSARSGDYDDYSPRQENPGTWEGNTSHSNAEDGFWIGSEFDESTGEKRPDEPKLEQPFRLEDFTSFKNGEWGIWLRNGEGDFENIRIADSNAGIQNWGDSNLRDSLFVGRSANADDTLDQHVGWQLYDHPFSFTDVHFAGFTGEFDAAISNGWGFGRSTAHSVEGLTFADDGTEDHKYLHTLTIEPEAKVSDQGGVIAGAVIDIDGSLTGIVGGVLTPGVVDYNPNKHYDVLNYTEEGAEAGKDAAGFNASEGAVWLEDERAWVHTADVVIGKMAIFDGLVEWKEVVDEAGDVVTDENGDALLKIEESAVPLEERAVFTVERSDNQAKLLVNQDAMVSYSPQYQMNVDANGGVEYIFEYVDALPKAVAIELSDMPFGAEVLYRFKGLPEDVVFREADAAPTREAFEAADGTAWFRDEAGDYLVKAVADRFLHWKSPRTDTADDLERFYNDEFKIWIADSDLFENTPDGNPYTSREEHPFVAADPDPVPDRVENMEGFENRSPTVEISDEDQRWSEATSWNAEVPGVEDIVVIGEGQRIVLDQDTTVKAILIDGGELVVEDTRDVALAADWVLVVNGGLFQVGTEENPFQHDFELTLEGDEQDNDVDVMALTNPENEEVVRAVAYEPPETTQRTVVDETEQRAWSEYTDTFDADGDRIQREITFDDGRVTLTTFDNGVRSTQLLTDVANVKAWSEISRTFDADGALVSSIAENDNGRVTSTTYESGVRATQSQADEGNVKPWTVIEKTFDANGKLASNTVEYDDGRVTSTTYENGVRVTQSLADEGKVKPWSAIEKTFDANGRLASNVVEYDNGRVTSTTYENGVRASVTHIDGGSVKPWTEIVKTFDANGKLTESVTVHDDGRVQTVEYENGTRSLDTTVDEGNEFVWSSRVVEYGLSGARESVTVYNDDGTEDFTSFLPDPETEVGFISEEPATTPDGPSFFDPFNLAPQDELILG